MSVNTSRVLSCGLLIFVVALSSGCPPPETIPTVSSFQINNGAATANSRTVTLDSVTAGFPTDFIASESPTWDGATWQSYSESATFQLSSGNGLKTVYFAVANGAGVSEVFSDTVTLNETETTVLLPGNVPLVLVRVSGGTYSIGRVNGEQDSYISETPQHSVTVPSFWMGKYELTKRQWVAVMGTTPWSNNGYVLNNLDAPAELVTWEAAKQFITALNNYTGLTFRLPSEAEWEFACRAGTTTRFYWGNDATYSSLPNNAWYIGNAWDASQAYAHVVAQKPPNALGLYDMSGNVMEWCEDDWHEDYTGAPSNGSAWGNSNTSKVVRGGSWYSSNYDCRSASRAYYSKTYATYLVGLRVAKSQ